MLTPSLFEHIDEAMLPPAEAELKLHYNRDESVKTWYTALALYTNKVSGKILMYCLLLNSLVSDSLH